MEHIHLKECESTQDFALDLLKSKENFIISCDIQNKGRGQGGKVWDALGDCISFSFDITPAIPLSLTSLEIGVLVSKFFISHYQLSPRLKWPNDLLNEFNQKCGGILINNPSGNKMIVGIGINLSGSSNLLNSNYKIPAGFLFGETCATSKENMCYNIVQFIHQNRINASAIIQDWNKLCGHINKTVTIFDDESETHGVFKGIGVNGQAILDTKYGPVEFYSGSLKFEN